MLRKITLTNPFAIMGVFQERLAHDFFLPRCLLTVTKQDVEKLSCLLTTFYFSPVAKVSDLKLHFLRPDKIITMDMLIYFALGSWEKSTS